MGLDRTLRMQPEQHVFTGRPAITVALAFASSLRFGFTMHVLHRIGLLRPLEDHRVEVGRVLGRVRAFAAFAAQRPQQTRKSRLPTITSTPASLPFFVRGVPATRHVSVG